MILSAFYLPIVGLSVVAFPAGLSAVFAAGLVFLLLIPAPELPEIVHCIGGFIPGKHGVVLCADNPSVRVFLENCFPFGIADSYHVFTLSVSLNSKLCLGFLGRFPPLGIAGVCLYHRQKTPTNGLEILVCG